MERKATIGFRSSEFNGYEGSSQQLSAIKLAFIQHNLPMIWHPGNPSFWGLLAKQLGLIKCIVTGQLEQLDPSISAVGDVANRPPA
jgi:hypothetical protein